MAPFLFTEERCHAGAVQDVDSLATLLRLKPGARILDHCCGVGRHSIELARRGFRVTGVDRTRLYLDRARQAAAVSRLDIEFVQSGMDAFCRPAAFDAVLNLFTSFGFFETDAEERRVLAQIAKSLAPSGTLVIDVLGKEVLCRKFQPRSWQSDPTGDRYLLEERTVQNGWSRVENRWIVFNETGRHEFRWNIRVYSGRELELLLREAGFRQIELFGNQQGAPYDADAARLVAVARN